MEFRNLIFAAAAALTLAACGLTGQTASTGSQSKDGSGSATPSPGFTRFTDIPMPANNTIDLERSLILGSDQQWTGRLVINSGSSVADMYEFYRREMPNFGWNEVTTVRAANSVLVFQQNQRVVTIQITPTRGITGGSTVDLTMAPRGGTGGNATPPRTSQVVEPAPARGVAAPRATVESAPLR